MTSLALMRSWVKFFLFIATATLGGSADTWNTVLAICPLALPSLHEQTMKMP
jgi:hypothetical protein